MRPTLRRSGSALLAVLVAWCGGDVPPASLTQAIDDALGGPAAVRVGGEEGAH